MAVIAYDRYNVIVKGMSGTRMTASMKSNSYSCKDENTTTFLPMYYQQKKQ